MIKTKVNTVYSRLSVHIHK